MSRVSSSHPRVPPSSNQDQYHRPTLPHDSASTSFTVHTRPAFRRQLHRNGTPHLAPTEESSCFTNNSQKPQARLATHCTSLVSRRQPMGLQLLARVLKPHGHHAPHRENTKKTTIKAEDTTHHTPKIIAGQEQIGTHRHKHDLQPNQNCFANLCRTGNATAGNTEEHNIPLLFCTRLLAL